MYTRDTLLHPACYSANEETEEAACLGLWRLLSASFYSELPPDFGRMENELLPFRDPDSPGLLFWSKCQSFHLDQTHSANTLLAMLHLSPTHEILKGNSILTSYEDLEASWTRSTPVRHAGNKCPYSKPTSLPKRQAYMGLEVPE